MSGVSSMSRCDSAKGKWRLKALCSLSRLCSLVLRYRPDLAVGRRGCQVGPVEIPGVYCNSTGIVQTRGNHCQRLGAATYLAFVDLAGNGLAGAGGPVHTRAIGRERHEGGLGIDCRGKCCWLVGTASLSAHQNPRQCIFVVRAYEIDVV